MFIKKKHYLCSRDEMKNDNTYWCELKKNSVYDVFGGLMLHVNV